MTDEKCCQTCKYFHTEEGYRHDHYLIPTVHYCMYETRYHDKEIKPDHCCENYLSRSQKKTKKK